MFHCIKQVIISKNNTIYPLITMSLIDYQVALACQIYYAHLSHLQIYNYCYRIYIVCTLHILLLYNVNPLLHKPNQSKLSYILWDDEDILMQNKRKLERLYWYEIYYMNKIQVVCLMEIFILFKLGLMLRCVVALLDHMEHFMQIKFKKLIFMAACTCICHFITNKMGVSVP